MNEFKKLYMTAKVWSDMDDAIDKLTAADRQHLAACLEIVKEYTGLDMRQDFTLGVLRARIVKGLVESQQD